MKKLIVIIFLFGSLSQLQAQRNVKDSSISTPLIGVHYSGVWTEGDLADRYGFLNHIGLSAGYKFASKWYIGFDGNFIFGNDVRMTGIFDHLVDSYGNITDVNGDIALVYVYPRGFNTNLSFGRLFTVLSPNENSGIFVHFGAGYLLHRMRIETQDQVVPQIELDYKKGYDRMTTGLNTHQFVGYSFMSNGGYYNFYAGIYVQEGFTKNRRTIFYDQPDLPVSTDTRLDIQFGLRAGWYIPFYKRQPKDFYFN